MPGAADPSAEGVTGADVATTALVGDGALGDGAPSDTAARRVRVLGLGATASGAATSGAAVLRAVRRVAVFGVPGSGRAASGAVTTGTAGSLVSTTGARRRRRGRCSSVFAVGASSTWIRHLDRTHNDRRTHNGFQAVTGLAYVDSSSVPDYTTSERLKDGRLTQDTRGTRVGESRTSAGGRMPIRSSTRDVRIPTAAAADGSDGRPESLPESRSRSPRSRDVPRAGGGRARRRRPGASSSGRR